MTWFKVVHLLFYELECKNHSHSLPFNLCPVLARTHYDLWYCLMMSNWFLHFMLLMRPLHSCLFTIQALFLWHWASLCPSMPQKYHLILETPLPVLPPLPSLVSPPCRFPLLFLHTLVQYQLKFLQFLHLPQYVPLPLTEGRWASLLCSRLLFQLQVSLWISVTSLHIFSKSSLFSLSIWCFLVLICHQHVQDFMHIYHSNNIIIRNPSHLLVGVNPAPWLVWLWCLQQRTYWLSLPFQWTHLFFI